MTISNTRSKQLNSKTSTKPLKIKSILEEYLPDNLKDDDKMLNIKQVITELEDTDRTLLLLYTDLGSMQKVGNLLHVSTYTICVNIQRIREIIKKKLKNEN